MRWGSTGTSTRRKGDSSDHATHHRWDPLRETVILRHANEA